MNAFSLGGFVDQVLFFVSQWVGVAIPRIVAAVVGLLIVLLTAVARWDRKVRIAPALLWLLVGGFLLAIAIDTRLLHAMAHSSFLSRIRVLLALLSMLVMAVTFESIRISRLQERYALLWIVTAGMVLLVALFPQTIDFLTLLLGVQYVAAVVAVVFTFLLLVVFHFSIALSRLEEDRARIAQRCALVELRVDQLERHLNVSSSEPAPKLNTTSRSPVKTEGALARAKRKWRGTEVASLCVIFLATFSVLGVGLRTREPLIGDEVTHYFMLENQARMLPVPTYQAMIPNGWSEQPEVRHYNHPNGWHYLGAIAQRLSRGSFGAVQVFHTLFWLQLLLVAYGWSRSRGGVESRATLLLLIVLASIPMNLLFSISFYQDVPLAAQALTAFYLLDRRRYLWAAIFMAFALWMKVTGVIFLVPFMALAAIQLFTDAKRAKRIARPVARLLLVCVVVAGAIAGNTWMLQRYATANYYPEWQMERLIKNVSDSSATSVRAKEIPSSPTPARSFPTAAVLAVTAYEAEVIANHPDDLIAPINFMIYGGGLIWLILFAGLIGLIRPRSTAIRTGASRRRAWPIAVGFFYLIVSYWQLRTAPDARFFLPAIPFILLPLCEWTMRLPKSRWWLIGAAVMGLLQSVYVLDKAADLRRVTPELQEAIRFLEQQPPEPARIFMYPEGNYRLFPVQHEWYLSYLLREFWRGDNDYRLELLRHHQVGAIVIKKHLIQPVDNAITNLGVYPPDFVLDIASDNRFTLVFENDAVSIFWIAQNNSWPGGVE